MIRKNVVAFGVYFLYQFKRFGGFAPVCAAAGRLVVRYYAAHSACAHNAEHFFYRFYKPAAFRAHMHGHNAAVLRNHLAKLAHFFRIAIRSRRIYKSERYAERSAVHSLLNKGLHLLCLICRWLAVFKAHYRRANHAVANKERHVCAERLINMVKIAAECEAVFNGGWKRAALEGAYYAKGVIYMPRRNRGGGIAAHAGYLRGYALLHGADAFGVFFNYNVLMAVRVYKAGRKREPGGIYNAFGLGIYCLRHGGYFAA